MASWWNKSGGLAYHYLAWRHKKLWLPYQAQLKNFFEKNIPVCGQLVIIGASGGYTLPNSWLSQFEQIFVVDPDPLAHFFFHRQHPNLSPIWSKKNYLLDSSYRWDPSGLNNLLRDYPDCLPFFSNIIGQLPLLIREPDLSHFSTWSIWQKEWSKTLSKKSWVSVHDLFSSQQEPNLPFPSNITSLSKQDLIEKLYSKEKSVTLTDHLTYNLLPKATTSAHFIWPLFSQQIHLVEVSAHLL